MFEIDNGHYELKSMQTQLNQEYQQEINWNPWIYGIFPLGNVPSLLSIDYQNSMTRIQCFIWIIKDWNVSQNTDIISKRIRCWTSVRFFIPNPKWTLLHYLTWFTIWADKNLPLHRVWYRLIALYVSQWKPLHRVCYGLITIYVSQWKLLHRVWYGLIAVYVSCHGEKRCTECDIGWYRYMSHRENRCTECDVGW